LGKFGQKLFTIEKNLAYADNDLGREQIEGAFTIPVLWTDRHLIAFGICKDFCAIDSTATPYEKLGVDLVVVPSMGEKSTMEAHLTVAKILHVAGGRAFVVQQDTKHNSSVNTGWVLAPNKMPNHLSVNGMECPSWSVHEWTQE